MATTNPVSQVLVTANNAAPLAAGSRETALAVGQVGVFNYHTGFSVDASSPVGDLKDVYIAVGIDPDATGALVDVNRSAGQVIQARNAKSYTVRGPVLPVAKVIDLTAFVAKCEEDYQIKIEFRNQKSYAMNGYNQFAKTFNYRTGCCADECTTCEGGDCNELALGLTHAINVDPDGLATAVMLDLTAGEGALADEITEAEYDAWIADVDNAGKCLGIRITSVPLAIANYCSVNLEYYYPRGTDMIISLPTGFTCNGTLTIYKELVYSEGVGYDIQQLEYFAGGFNGKPGPYRVSSLTNLPRKGFQYFAVKGTLYVQLILTYDQQSVGGWLEYLNNLETVIAIPCASTTTLTGLVAILDVVFAQFAPMAGDAAIIDCDNPPVTSLTAATDGIESLS